MSIVQSISNCTYNANIKDYLNSIRRNNNGIKDTLPVRNVYYSTDAFIPAEFINPDKIIVSTNSNQKNSNIENSNQVNFLSNSITLGNYDGINIELKNYGGTFLPPYATPVIFASKNGQPITAQQKRAGEIARKLSTNAYAEIGEICTAINIFSKVRTGKVALQSVPLKAQESLKAGLQKVGVDLSKPFSINGEEFYVRPDGRIDYLNIKKYVKREDGKIEMHDVTNYKMENGKVIEL